LAGIHAALERLICFVRAGAVLGFGQILSVDCLAMVDVRRQLRGDQAEGLIWIRRSDRQ
jgi:hypothetical protein